MSKDMKKKALKEITEENLTKVTGGENIPDPDLHNFNDFINRSLEETFANAQQRKSQPQQLLEEQLRARQEALLSIARNID